MATYDRTLLKILVQHGYTPTRHGKGSHEIWYSPIADKKYIRQLQNKIPTLCK